MDIYAPEYFSRFKCIADKCTHSCCVGWQIQIDRETFEKYEKLNTPLGLTIKSHIDEIDGEHFIRLCEDGRCPFLCKNGLCRIISELGEDYISDICKEHPRFYSQKTDRIETGLGMVCREAAGIILSSDSFNRFIKIGEWDSEVCDREYDARKERDKMLDILADKGCSYNEKVQKLKFTYNILPSSTNAETCRDLLSGLEYMNQSDKKLFLDFTKTETDLFNDKLTRFLAYMIYRHVGNSQSDQELNARLRFCILCTSLLEALIASDNSITEEKVIIYASKISEEIEYSEENTENLIFEFECLL